MSNRQSLGASFTGGASRFHSSKRRHKSFPQYHLSRIPIVIPTFENPTYTRGMVGQLRDRGLENIVIIDNASISEPMQDLLSELRSEVVVIDLPENIGPHYIFKCSEAYRCLPDLFCITDPDLSFNPDMPDDFLQHMLSVSNRMESGKVGLALDIADHANFLPVTIAMADRSYSILEWESRFWTDCIGQLADGAPVYRADVDTTFALYNKTFFDVKNFYKSYRVAGKYTCRHLPWYSKNEIPVGELATYRSRGQHSFYFKEFGSSAFAGSWSDHANRYCIYVVSPKGYDHHQAFDEVALGLSAAFAERGGSAPLVHHPSAWAGRVPIVLGAHLLSPAMGMTLPAGSVIYNLEQVDRASGWINGGYVELMRRHAVVDYSHRNVQALQALGIAHARLLPLGHADVLERIQPSSAQNIDVLFYGSLNERRTSILDAIRARGAHVVHLFNVYGAERDAAIARSKVVLNLHHYEAAIFESARVSYLLANGACVVTEGIAGDPDLTPYEGGLAICGYDELVELCMLLLGEDAVRAELGKRGQALMRAHRQADALGRLFAPERAAA